jgi:hypothetical protein
MDGVIELQLQPSNMNRKDSLILAGHANCSFIASPDSTVRQSSRWLICSWSLPGQLPSSLSHNLPDSLLGTARCPPSLTTPFRPLLTCSHSLAFLKVYMFKEELLLSPGHFKWSRKHQYYMATNGAGQSRHSVWQGKCLHVFLSLHFPPPGHLSCSLSNPCAEWLV